MQLFRQATNSDSARECATEVMESLPPIIWFLRRQMRQHRGSLSLLQFRALVRIDREPSINVTTVADHLGASLPTASRILSGLVDRKLLTRSESSSDRRRKGLELTPRGKAVLHRARGHTREKMETALQALTMEQKRAVVEAMHALNGIFAPNRVNGVEIPDAAKRARRGRIAVGQT